MSQLARPNPHKCPVCSARFRGSTTCSRCGTDLTLLMRAVASAWVQRERAHEALRNGQLTRAFSLAASADRLSSTRR